MTVQAGAHTSDGAAMVRQEDRVTRTPADAATAPAEATEVFTPDDVERALEETATRLRRSVVEVRSGGQGAGTIWRRDGLIVTNHHVAGREQAEVILADGRAFRGTVIARDAQNDLAILRIPALDVPAASIGDARSLRAGELVLAVGHPFGVRGALTVGVVSNAHRPVRPGIGRELVVADVRLGPGNSGGPLTNALGQVVGINAMVAGGMALAVPSHLVERLLGADGDRPRLGVEVQDVELAPLQAAQAGAQFRRGVLVLAVRPGSVGETAGLGVGDVLLAVDGRPTPDGEALAAALAKSPGGAMRLRLMRGSALREVVAAAPAERKAA
jgi:serine protease Do